MYSAFKNIEMTDRISYFTSGCLIAYRNSLRKVNIIMRQMLRVVHFGEYRLSITKR